MQKANKLSRLVWALLLSAPLSAVQASPVVLQVGTPGGFAKDKIKTKPITEDRYAFHLDRDHLVWGDLATIGSGTALASIDISGAYLLNSDGSRRVDFQEIQAGQWAQGLNWQEQWSLAPTALEAGDWTMVVVEQGYGSKQYNSYRGSLNITQNATPVPEPQMILLSLTALGAMAWVSRKRKSV